MSEEKNPSSTNRILKKIFLTCCKKGKKMLPRGLQNPSKAGTTLPLLPFKLWIWWCCRIIMLHTSNVLQSTNKEISVVFGQPVVKKVGFPVFSFQLLFGGLKENQCPGSGQSSQQKVEGTPSLCFMFNYEVLDLQVD